MIHHVIQSAKPSSSSPGPSSPVLQTTPSSSTSTNPHPEPSQTHGQTEPDLGEHIDVQHDQSTNTYTLKNIDPTSAGDNLTFLRSKLTWSTGDDGRERVLDEDGNGVMMGWEEPLMVAHVEAVKARLKEKMERGEEVSVLNIGFGLGIVSPSARAQPGWR
jgi:hypothetical protein